MSALLYSCDQPKGVQNTITDRLFPERRENQVVLLLGFPKKMVVLSLLNAGTVFLWVLEFNNPSLVW